MKFYFLTLSLLLYSITLAQVTFRLMDEEYETPISDAKIFNSQREFITQTDDNGYFTLPIFLKVVIVQKTGYMENFVALSPSTQTLFLLLNEQLTEVEASSQKKEAERLIKEVIKQRKVNHPDNLESYQFVVYNKALMDAEPLDDESLNILKNRNKNRENKKDSIKYDIDSSDYEFNLMLKKSALYMAEKVQRVKHSRKYGNKSEIIAQKTAGLKEPIYEFLIMKPISYYLDEDYFNFFVAKYINPVSKLGLDEYKFQIIDTINENGAPIITLNFSPRYFDKVKKPIIGYIKIDNSQKAITEFYAERTKSPYAYISMKWKKMEGYYFPENQNFNLEFGDQMSIVANGEGMEMQTSDSHTKSIYNENSFSEKDSIPKQNIFLTYYSSFKEFKIPAPFEKKEFKGYENEISDSILKFSTQILDSYRDNTSSRELETYATIDSVFQAEGVEKYIKYNHILTRFSFPIGKKLEWNFLKLIQINEFEGLRTEANLRTNENFSTHLGIQGYFAYGFKDRRGKFGLGTNYRVNKKATGNIFLQYKQDVQPMARYNREFLYERIDPYRFINYFYYRNYFSTQSINLGYEQDFFRNITASFSAEYEKVKSEVLYSYNFNSPYQKYSLFNTHLDVMWRPFSKYFATPYGKVTRESRPSYVRLHFLKSYDVLKSDFNFETIELAINHVINNPIGALTLFGSGGYTWGSTPLFYNFEGNGNAKKGEDVWKRISITGSNMFETLEAGRFYMDRYLAFHVKQSFPTFKIFKNRVSSNVVYSGLWGDQTSFKHSLLDISAPNNYYQEVGLEFYRIWNILGLGAYYRLGNYAEHNFQQDFYLKITLKSQFF